MDALWAITYDCAQDGIISYPFIKGECHEKRRFEKKDQGRAS